MGLCSEYIVDGSDFPYQLVSQIFSINRRNGTWTTHQKLSFPKIKYPKDPIDMS